LENFSALSKAELKAFAFVRIAENLRSTVGLRKNKGKLEDSRNEGSETLIRAAFDLRGKCKSLLPLENQPANGGNLSSLIPVPLVQAVYQPGDISQFHFTIRMDFVELVKRAFDPFEATCLSRGRQIEIDLAKVQEGATTLHDILQGRLARHIEQRVDEYSRTHWVWQFVRNNVGRVAATMALMDHVIEDIEPAKWRSNMCLLRDPRKGSFVPVANEIESMEGCYLSFDREMGRFVRSGKTCNPGRTFAVRWREHEECSRKQMLESRFYQSYPSRSLARANDGMRRGYFDNLQLFCGLGFNRTNLESLKPLVECDSIFSWKKDVLERIQKKSFCGARNIQDKQLHMVAYLCEICYELALAPEDNVSQSQGFESVFGFSGRRKETSI
jgi:hypothetical protein